MRLGVELGLERRIVWGVEVAAFACAAEGRDALAQLLGAAGALREVRQTSATLDDPSIRDRCLAGLTERVGATEAARHLADGADADLESLLDAAVRP